MISISSGEINAVKLRIRAGLFNMKKDVVEALSAAADTAESIMASEVPVKSGALRSSIRVSGINYSPGGAGGGGFWEVEVKAGEGIPYAGAVVQGSGLFGPSGTYIYPAQGNVMVFTKEGEGNVFTRYTRGQKAQTDWIIKAQQAANAVIESRIRSIDLSG